MSTKLFADFGVEVFEEEGILFVYFDTGESASGYYCKGRITEEMFKKLVLSEKDAYEVIINLPVSKVRQEIPWGSSLNEK